jgi:hypothetical protein
MYLRLLRRWSPWSPAESLRWAALGVFGLAAWIVAWWSAAHKASFNDQIPWATVAVAGFILVAYADVTWLLRARNAIVQRREALLPADPPSLATVVPLAVASGSVVGGPGLDRFHRADCPLAAGKGWPTIDVDAARGEGRRACGVCAPGGER